MSRLDFNWRRSPRPLAACAAVVCIFTARAAFSATTPRYAHVSAYMVDGRILIAGGINGANAPIATVEILDTQRGSNYVSPAQTSFAASMAVARASATITVLPNGHVLVAGGWDGSSARSDAEVYDPMANTWTTVAGMSSARFDHTASLLNDGTVLLCGGRTAAGAITATCDLFTPSGAGGAFAATGSLLLGRAFHTATVLRDGSVWISGGWNPAIGNGGWIVTAERYTPSTGQWQATQPLNAARAYHTSTLTGDNKVLVAGGYNGRNVSDALGLPSKGNLATSELYDPTGGSVTPGPPLQARVQKHTAALQGSGEVSIYGGLGNIAGTELTASAVATKFTAGSYVSGNSPAYGSGFMVHSSTSGAGTIPMKFFLGTAVTGDVIEGRVLFKKNPTGGNDPKATLSDGSIVSFMQAVTTNVADGGLSASLAGAHIGCDPDTHQCGLLQANVTLDNMGQGSYAITEPLSATSLYPGSGVTGSLTFSPSPITKAIASGSASISAGNISVHAQFTVPAELEGWAANSVTCALSPSASAAWTETSSYSVTLNGGSASAAGPFSVQTAGGVSYIDINPLTFTGVTGALNITADEESYSLSSPLSIPVSPSAILGSLSCSLKFGATGLNLANETLTFDKFDVWIGNMVFGDKEWFTPSLNQWAFSPASAQFTRPYRTAEGAATILTAQDDLYDIGGRSCTGATCASLVASSNTAGNRQDSLVLFSNSGFTAGSASDPLTHAFHSANLLPDGTILLAGGTDGTSVLQSAEIFNPTSGAFSSVASMNIPREKHSANLLPNGRVLVAGGYAATSASTGPTNTAEIYYPDAKVFVPTAVMTSSHSQHAAVTMPDGNVFVAGGYNNLASVTGIAEIYFATAAAWRQIASMPGGQERAIAPAVQLKDGRIMMCGGTNSNGVLDTCLAYAPATNSWASLSPMPTTLQNHTMTLLFDGRVLVAGGDDGFGETTSSYIYDPGGDSWSSANPLQNARFGHSATLLPNGTVMITGGVQQTAPIPGSPANALKIVEYFHPDASYWTSGGNLDILSQGERSFHTATLATNGWVYIIGGANGSIGVGQGSSFYTRYESSYFTLTPDGYSRSAPGPSQRQSSISSVSPSSPFLPGGSCTSGVEAACFKVTGSRFRGATEASGGGAASANSSFNYPRLMLQKIDGAGGSGSENSPGFIVDLTSSIPHVTSNLASLDTNLSVPLPATNAGLPYGWYMTWVGNNDIHSVSAPLVQVGPAKPAGAVTGLSGQVMGVSSITYSWTGIGGVDGYNVYSATSGVFLGTAAASSPAFVQQTLQANATGGIIVAGYTLSGDGPATHSATYYTLAAAPLGPQIASVTFNTLLLQWNANSNAAGTIFEVSQSSDNFATNVSTPVPAILGLTQNFVTIANLSASTTYYFRVRAFNHVSVPSDFSASVSTLTRASISGVAGTALGASSIQWSWTPSGAVINYRVYNSTTGDIIATPVSNSYTDVGLEVNSRRVIAVSAVTAAGESPLSASATVYTLANAPARVDPPIVGLSADGYTVQWAPNGNPNGTTYDLAVTQPGPVVSTTVTTALFAGVTGLSPSSLSSVVLYAANGDGIPSSPLVIGSTYTLANPPTLLQISGVSASALFASWSANSNSPYTYYEVTYSSDNFATNVSTAIGFAAHYGGSTVTISGLITSTTYTVRVQASNPYGQITSFSNFASTFTYNGGAPLGSLAGTLTAVGDSEFSGTLITGRSVDLRAPSGAVPVDTTVTISSFDASGGLCPNGLNLAVSLTPSPMIQPRRPIYFTSSYYPGDIGAVATTQIVLARYEPISGTCVPLETSFNTTAQTFTAQLNHFSLYQLVRVPTATNASSARIFPNPFRAASDSYVTIDRLPPGARVRVMTLSGAVVLDDAADSVGLLTWAGKNGGGRPVASGLYLVVMESGGVKKIAKLAVVR